MAVEIKEHGRGDDSTGSAVPVAVGQGTGLLGLPQDLSAGAPSRDGGAAGGLGHCQGGGECGDEEKDDLVDGGHC